MPTRKLLQRMLWSLMLALLCGWSLQAGAWQAGSPAADKAVRADPSALKAQKIGSLRFTPCRLKGPEMFGVPVPTVPALCSTLDVPENAEAPKGRQITLHVSWVPPRTRSAAGDPVVVLAGGPGQSARESWPQMAPLLGVAMRRHPVLLIDHRGTGESNRLDCAPPDGQSLIDLTLPQIQALISSCPRQLADRADVRHYGTPEAVQDLERVREAMALERLNLLGISYGTRTAQHYARAHPERVRSMVLDSPLPNNRSLTDGAMRVYEVLDRVFEACKEDLACAEQSGDSRAQLIAALAALRQKPVSVRVPDSASERMISRRLTEDSLASTIRIMAYTPEMASLVPYLSGQLAGQHHEMAALLSQSIDRMMSRMIPLGTYYAVSCTEDIVDREPPAAIMQDWLRVNDLIRAMHAGCQHWPSRPLAKDFHAPLTGSVPTLIVSGGQDPIIPPSFGDDIAANLSRARHLLLADQGHNAFVSGCMPRVLAQFLKRPDPKALDVGCLGERWR